MSRAGIPLRQEQVSYNSDKHWYAVYSKPQKEELAEFHLRSKGLEVFFPKLLLPHRVKKRERVVPLFPNYFFTRINALSEEYGYAIWSPGVRRIVGFSGAPAPIDESIVDFLMKQASTEGVIPARSNLKAGQEVRINGGPFDGLVGIIQEPPNAKGRVKILLKLLSRHTQVDVSVRLINGGWVASRVPVDA